MHLPTDITGYKTYRDMFPKHILWYSTLFKIKLHPTWENKNHYFKSRSTFWTQNVVSQVICWPHCRGLTLNHFESESETHSVVSDSLWPHGLYSPWNSPDQNTGVGSLSLLQGGSFQPRHWTLVSPIAGGFCTSWATREAQEYWSG